MASEEELLVKITLKDDLTREAAATKKSVNALAKAVEEARKEVEAGGDPANLRRLQSEFDEARRKSAQLQRQVRQTADELRDMERAAKKTGDSTKKQAGLMQTAWGKLRTAMSNPLVTAVSAGAVALFAKSAIQSFSEVQDSTDALTATFGASGDRLVAWANESALAFNLSRKEALSAAQTIAIFGDSAGLAGQELEQFTISLTERAADAASFFGGTTSDAVEAFGAALRGEMEPIRRYGVMLDDATLRSKAFEMGLIETTKQGLTPQQKTLAAYNAIMEQTTRVQGDVARTSDSMANQIKQGQAQMENFKTTVGETLAVALLPIVKALNGLLSVFNGIPQPLKTVIVAMGALGAAALVLGPRIAAMSAEMRAAGVSAAGMKQKMSVAGSFVAGPWGIALAAGTIALTHFLMEQAEASARVDEFANSIDGVTGKLNEAGVALVARTLMQDISDDDWQLLAQVGVTIEDVTAAVIGSEGAWAAYSDRLAAIQGDSRVGATALYDALGALRNNVQGLRKDVADGTREWEIAERAQAIASRSNERIAYTSGTVLAALQKVNPVLGTYRDLAYSSSFAASALRIANQQAADATDRLSGGLQGLAGIISEQQALASYQAALDAFIKEPSEETALAVSSAMTSAASAIEDPGKKAEFTKRAVDDIRTAAQDAGMKLNPELDKGLLRAQGQARLLETQIDRAVRARVVDITLRFSDGRTTYGGGKGDGPRHGGYTDGWISGAGGPTSDYAPIWASRGEYVLRAGAASALRAAIGDAGMWQLNHADRSMPSFLDSPVPPIVVPGGGGEPALVGAGAPVINIGEIRADSGIDVQSEVLWAMRRADRIRRERG